QLHAAFVRSERGARHQNCCRSQHACKRSERFHICPFLSRVTPGSWLRRPHEIPVRKQLRLLAKGLKCCLGVKHKEPRLQSRKLSVWGLATWPPSESGQSPHP